MYHLPTGHTCTQRILSTGRIRPQYNTRNPQTGLDKYMVLWYSEKAFISAKNFKDIIDIIFFFYNELVAIPILTVQDVPFPLYCIACAI